MPNICVRWQGKKLDVAADMAEPPLMLKAQLFGMTGVEPDRQKIIVKVGFHSLFPADKIL
jgi:hypothetical protein